MATTQKKGSFRRNVILTFLVISVISLGVTGFISYQFVNLIGGFTTSQSSDALEVQIQRNIEATAVNNADAIRQKLANAQGMVTALAEEMEAIFQEDSTFDPREVYYDYFFGHTSLGPAPSDVHFDSAYNINVSWNYSSWYIPGSDASNYAAYETAYAERLSRVSNLDYMFQYVHQQMPEFRWLYVTFPDDMFINYPGSILAADTADRSSPETWFVPTDPIENPWYQEMRSGNGDIIFVDPYYDPIDGVLLVSIGKAVYFENNTLIGVIAGDITVEDIRTKVLDVQVLESGYAALITDDGGIVAHPSVEDHDYAYYASFGVLPPLTDIEVDDPTAASAISPSQMIQITSGETGIIEYRRDLESYLLAYAPVGIAGYISIIVVPVNEVQAAIPALEARIQAANIQATFFILAITAAGIFIAGAVAVAVANQITGPLQYLMELATRNVSAMIRKEKLDTSDLQVDSSYMGKDDEIGELARAFQGMLDSIRDEETQ
ncbi:MAG: cache domain-containing protein [Candidatus Thorarchaeota archaeon]